MLTRDAGAAWRHGPTEGQPALRAAIAERFGVPAESVLVISGAQQGLDLLARCLIDPGDAVIVDRPGYLGAIQSFHAAGAKLIGWDIVKADIDELEDLLVRYRPKLIYTNPTFQNPTGLTMPVRTRRELLRLAERYRVPIVEDATYRELYFRDPPPPSLRDLDAPDIVIHLNSFSKVLAPGLRLGWLSAAPSIVDQMAIIKQRLDPHTQNLVQFAMAALIRDGSFDAHLATIRAEHARRCAAMLAAIQRHFPAGRAAVRASRRRAVSVVSRGLSRQHPSPARSLTGRWRGLRSRSRLLCRSRGRRGAAHLLLQSEPRSRRRRGTATGESARRNGRQRAGRTPPRAGGIACSENRNPEP